MSEKIVCACSSTEEKEVLDYISKNGKPADDLEFEKLCEDLDIGQSCESCLEDDCDIIDVYIKHIIDSQD